mgnify:CR=1 FL=1
MLDSVHEECGIAAVYRMDCCPEGPCRGAELEGASFGASILGGDGDAVALLPDMLIDLQNRGQLAAGISRYSDRDRRIIDTYKDVGSVTDVFHLMYPDPAKFRKLLRRYAGRAGIGHVRYATCGRDDPSYAQPLERTHIRKWKWFALCFNGNVANYSELRQRILERKDYHLNIDTDTEVLLHHLAYALRGETKPDFLEVFRHLAETVDGAYSLAFLDADGDLIVARDPYGFRPLSYAIQGNLFAAASESVALANRGFREVRDVEPGELIHVRPEGVRRLRFAESPRRAHCFFEYVYFSNVASAINGRSVYVTRKRLGEALARGETVPVDPADSIAVPVPDTAKAACDAMAYALGIPSVEGLMRNRYVGRTFIEGQNRAQRALRKYTALPEVLGGKRVFLVEDSIVRATTLRVIVRLVREQGRAREVHVRVACPPIMAPCSYGIDMSTVSELFAPRFVGGPPRGDLTPEELRRLSEELGTTSLRYLTLAELTGAIGIRPEDLCLGCLTGRYPTRWGGLLYEEALRQKGRTEEGRTYERLVLPAEP